MYYTMVIVRTEVEACVAKRVRVVGVVPTLQQEPAHLPNPTVDIRSAIRYTAASIEILTHERVHADIQGEQGWWKNM